MGNVNIVCNLDEAEAKEALEKFDLWLDPMEEAMVTGILTNYIFYEGDKKGKTRRCICTHSNCGTFTMERKHEPVFFGYRHGDMITCPVCGNTVKMIALGRMGNFDSLNREKWQRVTICREGGNGELLLLSGYAHREFHHDDLKPVPEVAWKCLTYLKKDKRGQWEHEWARDYEKGYGYWKWGLRKNVREPFQPGGYGWQQHEGDSWLLQPEAIGGSELRYCQVEEYIYQRSKVWLVDMQEPVRMVTKYLAYYTKYPTMEMAVKLGLEEAVTDLVEYGRKNHRDLNWDAATIQGFLRMDKQDARVFHCHGGGMPMLKSYHEAKRRGLTPNMKDFVERLKEAECMGRPDRLVDAAVRANQTIQVAANYVAKFRPELSSGQVLTLWGDYLNMARVLGYDLTRRDVVLPKDLRDRHDAASETLRYQKIAVDQKKHEDYNKYMRKMYDFEYGGLCIRCPGSVEEIVNEGKTLGHCVGGYAARHFDNKVNILFLRHARKPNTPWITIEIVPRKTGRDNVVIRQIHGYRNELYKPNGGKKPARPGDKYKWFLDVWKAWAKAGSPRDKKGRPVLPKSKEKTA